MTFICVVSLVILSGVFLYITYSRLDTRTTLNSSDFEVEISKLRVRMSNQEASMKTLSDHVYDLKKEVNKMAKPKKSKKKKPTKY